MAFLFHRHRISTECFEEGSGNNGRSTKKWQEATDARYAWIPTLASVLKSGASACTSTLGLWMAMWVESTFGNPS